MPLPCDDMEPVLLALGGVGHDPGGELRGGLAHR